jgi:hypothetical protein
MQLRAGVGEFYVDLNRRSNERVIQSWLVCHTTHNSVSFPEVGQFRTGWCSNAQKKRETLNALQGGLG